MFIEFYIKFIRIYQNVNFKIYRFQDFQLKIYFQMIWNKTSHC